MNPILEFITAVGLYTELILWLKFLVEEVFQESSNTTVFIADNVDNDNESIQSSVSYFDTSRVFFYTICTPLHLQ